MSMVYLHVATPRSIHGIFLVKLSLTTIYTEQVWTRSFLVNTKLSISVVYEQIKLVKEIPVKGNLISRVYISRNLFVTLSCRFSLVHALWLKYIKRFSFQSSVAKKINFLRYCHLKSYSETKGVSHLHFIRYIIQPTTKQFPWVSRIFHLNYNLYDIHNHVDTTVHFIIMLIIQFINLLEYFIVVFLYICYPGSPCNFYYTDF